MNNIEQITMKINEIVCWYYETPPDFTGINDLMNQRIQLSTLLFWYSTELGNVRKTWKQLEVETERTRRNSVKQMLDSGHPVTKATEHGKINSLDDYANEKSFDGLFHQMKFVFDSANEILNCMNQHISNLKKEIETG